MVILSLRDPSPEPPSTSRGKLCWVGAERGPEGGPSGWWEQGGDPRPTWTMGEANYCMIYIYLFIIYMFYVQLEYTSKKLLSFPEGSSMMVRTFKNRGYLRLLLLLPSSTLCQQLQLYCGRECSDILPSQLQGIILSTGVLYTRRYQQTFVCLFVCSFAMLWTGDW